jgi:hypothetical protein
MAISKLTRSCPSRPADHQALAPTARESPTIPQHYGRFSPFKARIGIRLLARRLTDATRKQKKRRKEGAQARLRQLSTLDR